MKRILIGIWALSLLAFTCLLAGFIDNEIMINKYEKGEYVDSKLSFLAVTESYVKYYNQGNIYYQNELYDLAIEEYDKALGKNPPEKKICKICVNKALAMVNPIDKDMITESNKDEILDKLTEAEGVLTKDGCASEDGKSGHDKDAQQLYNDIEKFKEEINNASQSNNPDDKKDDEKKDDEDKQDSQVENLEEKQEQLQDLQNQANDERYSTIEESQYYMDFDFYDGDSW